MNSKNGIADTSEGKLLTEKQLKKEIKKLPGWKIIQEDSMLKLTREYSFINFSQVLGFTKLIKNMADGEDHHPTVQSTWGKVTLFWWTHSVRGIKQKDFVMAARCDQIYAEFMAAQNGQLSI